MHFERAQPWRVIIVEGTEKRTRQNQRRPSRRACRNPAHQRHGARGPSLPGRHTLSPGKHSARLIDASRDRSKWITRERVGTRPGTAADFPKLTHTAFALQVCCIPQLPEKRLVSVDLREGLVPDVSSGQWQEPAWKDFARVRDEDKAFAIVQPAGRASDAVACSLAKR